MPPRLNTTELMTGAGEDEGEDGGVAGAPGRDDNVEEQGAGERERERERERDEGRERKLSNNKHCVYGTYRHVIEITWFHAYG